MRKGVREKDVECSKGAKSIGIKAGELRMECKVIGEMEE